MRFVHCNNFEPIFLKSIDPSGTKTFTGLTEEQFEDLLDGIPTLRTSYPNLEHASDVLYTYLLKLRTGRSNEEIAHQFKVTKTTIARRMNKAREALTKDLAQ